MRSTVRSHLKAAALQAAYFMEWSPHLGKVFVLLGLLKAAGLRPA